MPRHAPGETPATDATTNAQTYRYASRFRPSQKSNPQSVSADANPPRRQAGCAVERFRANSELGSVESAPVVEEDAGEVKNTRPLVRWQRRRAGARGARVDVRRGQCRRPTKQSRRLSSFLSVDRDGRPTRQPKLPRRHPGSGCRASPTVASPRLQFPSLNPAFVEGMAYTLYSDDRSSAAPAGHIAVGSIRRSATTSRAAHSRRPVGSAALR